MEIYLFTAGADAASIDELEGRLRSKVPNLKRLAKINEVTSRVAKSNGSKEDEPSYVIFPILTSQVSLERILSIAEQEHPGLFLIFITNDISAADYKRLIRGGNADWASLNGAPEEI